MFDLSSHAWQMLTKKVAESLHNMAVQRQSTIGTIRSVGAKLGIRDMEPVIRLDGNVVYVGVKWVFTDSEVAKRFYDDVLLYLGVKEVSEEQKK